MLLIDLANDLKRYGPDTFDGRCMTALCRRIVDRFDGG